MIIKEVRNNTEHKFTIYIKGEILIIENPLIDIQEMENNDSILLD